MKHTIIHDTLFSLNIVVLQDVPRPEVSTIVLTHQNDPEYYYRNIVKQCYMSGVFQYIVNMKKQLSSDVNPIVLGAVCSALEGVIEEGYKVREV